MPKKLNQTLLIIMQSIWEEFERSRFYGSILYCILYGEEILILLWKRLQKVTQDVVKACAFTERRKWKLLQVTHGQVEKKDSRGSHS